MQEVRATAKRLLAELERLTNEVHRDEVARAEQRMRIETLEAKAAEDFSLDVDTLVAEYGPDQLVPPTQAEAALDDVNLRRLISLLEELREASQLIVITHQKPTMEVADALYGVTMRDDGITAVISQRMRGQELVAAAN